MYAVRVQQRGPHKLEVVAIFHTAAARGNTTEHLVHALVAMVTGRTAAAGLLFEELGKQHVKIDRTGTFTHKDDASAAHQRVVLGERGALQRKFLCQRPREVTGKRPSGLDRFEPAAAEHTAADLDDLRQRDAERDLHEPDTDDVTREGKDLRPDVGSGPRFTEPVRAVLEDKWDVSVRLNVVHVRWLHEHAGGRRERRLDARHATAVLHRRDKPRLLAAHVSSSSTNDLERA